MQGCVSQIDAGRGPRGLEIGRTEGDSADQCQLAAFLPRSPVSSIRIGPRRDSVFRRIRILRAVPAGNGFPAIRTFALGHGGSDCTD